MVSLRLLLWFLDFNSTFNVDVDFFSLQAFSIAGIAGDLLTTPAGLNGKILGIPGWWGVLQVPQDRIKTLLARTRTSQLYGH